MQKINPDSIIEVTKPVEQQKENELHHETIGHEVTNHEVTDYEAIEHAAEQLQENHTESRSEYQKRTYSTLENANKSLEFLMPFGTDKNHCYEDDFEHIKFQIETI